MGYNGISQPMNEDFNISQFPKKSFEIRQKNKL